MLNNIEPSLIAETLSGPEVLACRKGKCSEFASSSPRCRGRSASPRGSHSASG